MAKNAKTPAEVKPMPNQSGMPDPLASMDKNLREDPIGDTFEKMQIGFDSMGPNKKKIKNTYSI